MADTTVINTPTGTSTVGDINAARETAVNQGLNPYSVAPTLTSQNMPQPPAVPTLNSTNTTPTPPVNVPGSTVPTSTIAGAGVTGTSAALDASTKALIDEQNKQITDASTAVGQDKSLAQQLIDKLSGKGDATVAAENAAGIPGLTQQLTDVTNEYNTKQLAFKHQEEAILNAPGITREQAHQQISELSRVHNQELADIAIRQSVASGNLTAASNLVNHKIDLQYGDLKDLISYQTNLLNSDQSRLSTAQTNKLQIQRDQNQQLYTKLTTEAKTLEDQKLETLKAMQANGAPQSAQAEVQAQTTPEGVISTAGKYGVSLADQQIKANIAKTYNEINATLPSGAYKLGSNPAVDGWIANINSGKAKLSDVPAALKNAVSSGLSTSQSSTADILTTTKASLTELNDMVRDDKGFSNAVGFKGVIGTFTGPIAGTEAATFTAKLNQTKNDVILPNLTLLHGLGRVTDREFQALSSAMTSLNVNLPQEDFKTELKTITDRINQLNTAPAAPADAKSPAKGADGAAYGFPGYVSDGKQWVKK